MGTKAIIERANAAGVAVYPDMDWERNPLGQGETISFLYEIARQEEEMAQDYVITDYHAPHHVVNMHPGTGKRLERGRWWVMNAVDEAVSDWPTEKLARFAADLHDLIAISPDLRALVRPPVLYCPDCQEDVAFNAANETDMADHGRCYECQRAHVLTVGGDDDDDGDTVDPERPNRSHDFECAWCRMGVKHTVIEHEAELAGVK